MRYRFLIVSLLMSGASARGADGPKVVAAWAAGPLEVRVAFDRAVPPPSLAGRVGSRIVSGEGVKAGDRYVPRKPGDLPSDEARGSLAIAAARLIDDGKTLVLATDPHARDTAYALPLPDSLGGGLVYRLRGVDLAWDNGKDDAKPEWSGWWPTLDAKEAAARLAGSSALDGLNARLKTPGRLTLKTLVALPKGKTTVVARSSAPLEIGLGNESAKSSPDPAGGHRAEVSAEIDLDLTDLTLTLTPDGSAPLTLAVEANGRPIAPGSLTLPWAPAIPTSLPPSPAPASVLAGGDPVRGAVVFKGDQAKCAACHKVRGEGGEVGPDLSDLVHRDRAWIYRNINEPSATIHPDYVPYTVVLKDGRVLVGIVRAEGADAIKVIDTEAKATTVARSEIEELRPGATSIMPVGLLGAVGEAGVKDLLAFLAGK